MPFVFRLLAVMVGLGSTVAASAQVRRDLEIDPPPPVLVPGPASEVRTNHYQALKLYLHARTFQSDSRFLDAVEAYQGALKLDTNAVAIYKALVPLCLNLERDEQAL